jgi:hypothetical protein
VTNEASRAAGWYDDETDAALLRYWDGTTWSPHTAPKPADAAAEPPVVAARPSDPLVQRIDPIGAIDAIDAIDESTTVRASASAPREHTTLPLPPDHAAAASVPHFSYEPYRSSGRRSSIALIVTGSLVAVALVAFGVVSSVVAFALR